MDDVLITSDGTHFVAAWGDLRNGTTEDLYGALLSASMSAATSAIPLSLASADQLSPTLTAVSSRRSLLAYQRLDPTSPLAVDRLHARFVSINAGSCVDGVACDDGNLCTQGDVCEYGMCFGGTSVTCPRSPCAVKTYCEPSTGGCVTSSNYPNGTACAGGTCQSGQCVPSSDGGTSDSGAGPG